MHASKEARPFGIEEEYLLLDPKTGVPSNSAAEIILATPDPGGKTEHEFVSSQLETSTQVCATASEAEDALGSFRRIRS